MVYKKIYFNNCPYKTTGVGETAQVEDTGQEQLGRTLAVIMLESDLIDERN